MGRKKNCDYICQSSIKARGWTDRLIKTFLGEPVLSEKPRYRKDSPLKLWNLKEVKAAERNPQFKIEMEKVERRRLSASKAVQTKTKKTLDFIDSKIDLIEVQKIDNNTLLEDTLHHRREFYECEDAIEEVDKNTLDRWIVNYIRHELTDYDEQLYNIRGMVGVNKAYIKYKNAVLDAVSNTYLMYKQACEEQKIQ